MPFTYISRAAVALAVFAAASCTVKNSTPPALSGPSGLALTLTVNAIPDSISQDGGSQSSVKVLAIGPNGKPLASLPLRLDMVVNGVAQDYGTLSARSIVTNGDGIATAVYTAPPGPVNGVFGSCNGLPGTCVSIVATATSTDFTTANPETVTIRLVPTGVLLPPALLPTPSFTVQPPSPAANSPAQFDASASCGGPLSGGNCPATAPSITQYLWNFGDGQSATGASVTHSFPLTQTYTVALTVTNAVGGAATTTKVITVGGGLLPTAKFTVSPTDAAVGQQVFFNAATSSPGAGHTLVSYRWNFGDGTSAAGVSVSHSYAAAGVYNAQLTVTDEVGQSVTSDATAITVGRGSTGPTAVFSYSPPSPVTVGATVTFNATPSTATPAGGAPSIYQWKFRCAPSACVPADPVTTSTSAIITNTYSSAGTFLVELTVFDTAGRSNSTSRLITVQ